MRRPLPLWQRNIIGAVVSALAIAVLVYFQLWPMWRTYRATVVPAHTARALQPLTVDGQTWELVAATRYEQTLGPGQQLPPGVIGVRATVEQTGTGPTFACFAFITDGQRRWRGSGPPCGGTRTGEWTFRIPVGVVPTAIDITGGDRQIVIRLLLSKD